MHQAARDLRRALLPVAACALLAAQPRRGADTGRSPSLPRLDRTEGVLGLPEWSPTLEPGEIHEIRLLAAAASSDPDVVESLVEIGLKRYEDRDQVLDDLALLPGDRARDLGCGIGWLSLAMAEAVVPGGMVHALDVREAPIAVMKMRARRRGPRVLGPLRPHVSKPTSTDLPDASLDVALFLNLGFMLRDPLDPDVAEPQRDVHRALRPGGRLLAVQWMGGPEGSDPLPYVLHLEEAGFELLNSRYDELYDSWTMEWIKL